MAQRIERQLVVSNPSDDQWKFYDRIYGRRGEIENRIEEIRPNHGS